MLALGIAAFNRFWRRWILDVVSAANVAPPANAKRFDLAGRWLLPGFIDAHIHAINIQYVKSLLATDGMTTGRSVFTVHYMVAKSLVACRSGSGYGVTPKAC